MDKVVGFKYADGSVGVLYPTSEGLDAAKGDIQSLARKDVPTGLKYKVADKTGVPSDRTFRSVWSVDDAELDDGVGNESNLFD